ncbi:MAG: PAS domain-containing protein [Proteobacteria bacterium]|nr:PAS domain-containing protein [Pseudomonadota bacterium]
MGSITIEARHPRLRRLLDYWQSKRRGGALPGRADLDPLDFPYVLGDIQLLDVLGEPPSFRYRLFGTNLLPKYGVDLTGRTVEEFPGSEARDMAIARCHQIVRERLPIYGERSLVLDGRLWAYSVLLLPLAQDGKRVDMILIAQIFEP